MHRFGVVTVEFFDYDKINQMFLLIYISEVLFFLPLPHPEQYVLVAESNHMDVLWIGRILK